ncbi:MAG: hypothetical protein M0Z69_11960 [Actinomycetota bacterium]|nr:hypothetical protein [Actinomycetota bacterium]
MPTDPDRAIRDLKKEVHDLAEAVEDLADSVKLILRGDTSGFAASKANNAAHAARRVASNTR